MPAMLRIDHYLDALSMAAARLNEESSEAGMEVPIPTCPEWSMRQLVAHQGMVHRWATAHVRGQDRIDTEAVEAEGLQHPHPGAWLMAGAEVLEAVLESAPADLDVPFFLADAGRPRDAWARRQAHETVIHAVDALSGRLGALPDPEEVDIDPSFAADGVDELLTGFLPRPRQRMHSGIPITVLVRTTDTGHVWTVELSRAPAVVHVGSPERPADTTWSGSAVALYLGLWNRGRHIEQVGRDVLPAWRQQMTVWWG